MYFEIDEFLDTLNGFTRQQTCEMIALQQDALIGEVSQPLRFREQTVVFRSFKFEIGFLHKLGNEIKDGFVVPSNILDRSRINKVLKNLSN